MSILVIIGGFMRILIIEDEHQLATAIAAVLQKENYTVDVCHDGETGLAFAITQIHDLIICDLMLPRLDGYAIIRALRSQNIQIPILILTAKTDSDETIIGLDCGADDYLTKPFVMGELLARLRALSRRFGHIVATNLLTFSNLSLNPQTLLVQTPHTHLQLTLKEAQVLELLLKNQTTIVSKELLITKIWGYDSEAEDNHVEVYISFLRKKLLLLNATVQIQTVRGLGYCLRNTQEGEI